MFTRREEKKCARLWLSVLRFFEKSLKSCFWKMISCRKKTQEIFSRNNFGLFAFSRHIASVITNLAHCNLTIGLWYCVLLPDRWHFLVPILWLIIVYLAPSVICQPHCDPRDPGCLKARRRDQHPEGSIRYGAHAPQAKILVSFLTVSWEMTHNHKKLLRASFSTVSCTTAKTRWPKWEAAESSVSWPVNLVDSGWSGSNPFDDHIGLV